MNRTELERELEAMHPACWGWALACCRRDRELAEEALQAAYLRILAGEARFEGRSSLKTWVFGVIRRTVLDEVRGRANRGERETTDEIALGSSADDSIGSDVAVEQVEERAAILAALGALSPRQREIIQLVFYHGMTIEEAADVMQVSLGSARTHYDRGKKALAGLLASTREGAQ